MRKFHKPFRATASRRAVIRGAVATGALLASRSLPVWAQQMQTHLPPDVEPKPKGPLVFRDYDQEELDLAYEQLPWAPNMGQVFQRWQHRSDIVRARREPARRISYGPTQVEQLDLFVTDRANAPIHVFIHGGGWRGTEASLYAFLSEMFVDAGAHFIALDFINVVDSGGELAPMVDQVQRALAWIYTNAASFGGDASQIYISGHSSGGHLAGVALTTDWQNDFGLPMNMVKGGLCISGMFDLYPVSLSSRNTYVNFNDEVIRAFSPQRNLDKLVAPVIVTHGSLETPEFQRQSREFADAVRASGKPISLVVGDSYNHMEMLDTLASPYGVNGWEALGQMGLAP